MGLIDGIESVLGLKAEADATRDADPDDLFGMSTAYMTMEADLGYEPAGEAALCFSDVDSTDFRDAMDEVRQILAAGEVETGTTAEFVEDAHGYTWVVLADDDVEDLVTSVHFAADTLVENGYGSRLLAAVFAFSDPNEATGWDESERFVYWVYSFRRGSYYPFSPEPGEHERDATAEFKLQSVLDGELDLEDDEAYWYPLWPENEGHPWE